MRIEQIYQCEECGEKFRLKQTFYTHTCSDGTSYITKIKRLKRENSQKEVGVA